MNTSSGLALELDDLHCSRGGRPLLAGLSAEVPPGRLMRVQGANGAGKTTLLRAICGLVTPERGEVRWRGQSIVAAGETYRRQLAYLGHVPALKDELSALENLLAGVGLSGSATTPQDARAALARAGLEGSEHLPVRRLSQGQRRRAALARLGLAAAAPLWVLDEPFSALDADACGWLKGLIAAHLARGGVVVLTTHQPVDFAPAPPEVRLTLAASRAADLEIAA